MVLKVALRCAPCAMTHMLLRERGHPGCVHGGCALSTSAQTSKAADRTASLPSFIPTIIVRMLLGLRSSMKVQACCQLRGSMPPRHSPSSAHNLLHN